jgi:NO-binding membrane sensor protein with MHYT domain
LLGVGYRTASSPSDDCTCGGLAHTASLLQLLRRNPRGLKRTLALVLCLGLGLAHFDGMTALLFLLHFDCILDRSFGLLHPL